MIGSWIDVKILVDITISIELFSWVEDLQVNASKKCVIEVIINMTLWVFRRFKTIWLLRTIT